MKNILIIIAIVIVVIGGFYILNNYIYQAKQAENMNSQAEIFKINPVSHASMVLEWAGQNIYVDPVGELSDFANYNKPDLVLITDIHGDHLSTEILEALVADNSKIIAPQAVYDQLTDSLKAKTEILSNGQVTKYEFLAVQATPMYNFPESEDAYHIKGRGNGYILESPNRRVYIAGDTGPTPEIKALQDIDIAFVPMNLPYTMDVEEAAEAVLAFKPKQVYPYHFRTPDGFSDVNKFKELVNQGGPNIEVVQLDWYSEN